MYSSISRWVLTVLVLALGSAAVQADIVITPGPGNFPNDENVLYNQDFLIDTGTTVQGVTNQSQIVVDFISSEVLTTPAQGQARIEAQDGAFQDLCIELNTPGATFQTLIFNLDVVNSAGDGNVSFTVNGIAYPMAFALDANGQNFFRVQATNNQSISEFCLTSDVPLADIQQVRIGGIEGAQPIPLPAAAWTGLAMLVCLAASRVVRTRRQ